MFRAGSDEGKKKKKRFIHTYKEGLNQIGSSLKEEGVHMFYIHTMNTACTSITDMYLHTYTHTFIKRQKAKAK